ncbi:hypothetical protein [Streptomyces sp. NPDC003943]
MPANAADTADTPEAAEVRVTGSWIPPFFSTLITLPLGFVALVFAMFSPMACDSCGGVEADRFEAGFRVAFPTFLVGLLVSLALLIAAWIPPRRTGFAVAAPLLVVVTLLVFAAFLGVPLTS